MTLQVMFVGLVWICLVAGWRQFFMLDEFDPSVYYGITKQRGSLTNKIHWNLDSTNIK